MKSIIILLLTSFTFLNAQNYILNAREEEKISELIFKMTLAEKIGQLVQIVGTRPSDTTYVNRSAVGSFLLGVNGAEHAELLQKTAVEQSRLGIPLLFANDVLHGYNTIFPIPLGEAASFNPDLVEKASAIAAFEAASDGTHWTYAPMVDIARDPRWGRIMEGSGEDPYLGSIMASARVKGFQGKDIKDKSRIAACPKHYVAYGAAEGGRDYNTVDISERTLREVYLPPFYSAIKSGAATVMSAFNDINGIPASANHFTLTGIIKNEWSWPGVIISDYNSIGELVKHRFAKDKKEAAMLGLNAGVDIDMVGDSIDGNVYAPHLNALFEERLISEETINESVRRVLRLKLKLGLFDNPYIDSAYYGKNDPGKAYKDSIARQLARESIVLLKNDGGLLPLKKSIKSIALIGPLAESREDIIGGWSAAGRPEDAITIREGLVKQLNNVNIRYAKGCEILGTDTSGFAEAVKIAKDSDIAILVIGEDRGMSGEAGSKVDLNLTGMQQKLVETIYRTGTPVVVILMNGRPLTINWIAEHIPSVLETWYTGTQGGNAIADVLLGKYNPSGKLPVTFPGAVGQIPLYYYQKSTGRPRKEEDRFTSKYLDYPNTPLYPFGYGLSYTTFKYSSIKTSKSSILNTDTVIVTVEVENTGSVTGKLKNANRNAGVESPAHQIAVNGFYKTTEFCGTCHNEKSPYGVWVKSTQLEWKEGPYAKEGVRCQDCHMPSGPSKTASMGLAYENSKQHLFNGAHDPGKIQGTIELRIHPDIREAEPGETVMFFISLFNQKTGHKFPSGSAEERLVWMTVDAVDSKGNKYHLPVDKKGFPGEEYTISADVLAYQDMAVPLELTDFKGIQRDGIPSGNRIFRLPYFDPQGRMTIMQWNTKSLGTDYRIGPRETKIETCTFSIPENVPPGDLKITATMNYQKLPFPVAEFLGVPLEEAEIIKVNEHSTTIEILN